MSTPNVIAVVIPCFRVKRHILGVIQSVGSEVSRIYIVDDQCPEKTGQFVSAECKDPRVKVLHHTDNQGVGGAMVTGYRESLRDGCTLTVKIDGDGQMDPALIPRFVKPILEGRADYTKGNRFYDLESLNQMPRLRLFGNAVLSFISKLASGYWNMMDPTNGYTAIHNSVLKIIPLAKLEKRYFFENDILFRLNTVRAVVMDIPMPSKYGDEESSMNIALIALTFPRKFLLRFFKRVFYNHFLREFNAGSVELIFGLGFLVSGAIFGFYNWYISSRAGVGAATGTIMLAALPVLVGFQLLIAALNYDIFNAPRNCLHKLLE
jgi:glycosyltransferase involved in cell wall biosynthesis